MKNLYAFAALLLFCSLAAQKPYQPDPAFNSAMTTLNADAAIKAILLQPDGKIVMGGLFSFSDGSASSIVRLNSNGTRDTSFDAGTGLLNTASEQILDMKLQPDGKILVAGSISSFDGTPVSNILRLNADGSIDTSFAGIFNGHVNSLELQPDGKVIAGGLFTYSGSIYSPRLARLNANGTFDTGFTSGISGESVTAVKLQPDGKILVSGDFNLYNGVTVGRLIRLNPNGTQDAGFASIMMNTPALSMALQPDGKILIGGEFMAFNGTTNIRRLARANPDGTTDAGFQPSLYLDEDVIRTVLLKPNGKIVVGGNFSMSNNNNINVLNNNGTQDNSFTITPGEVATSSDVHALALQPDGKILLGGTFSSYNNNSLYQGYVRILGTDYYTYGGSIKMDANGNGCDTADNGFQYLQFQVVNGATGNSYFSSFTGAYSTFLSQGTTTVTPILSNPAWFSVFPTSATVTFPAAQNPYVQDFCVTPNGEHYDVGITLLPLRDLVPGDFCQYRMAYTNRGNHTVSGSVSLAFNGNSLYLVSVAPNVSQQSSGLFSWDFTDLQPLETREINVRFEANNPSQTPPLNGGDVLHFLASATTSMPDEYPADNSFALNQTAVNSFDPNDKTCLEGDVIVPEQVGDYVDYMIRFENTGTYPARNITVKDVIDATKYDIATLRPISGSHNFITRISGNLAEFIFQDINLPFQPESNDGYVAFQIKTRPTLVAGDSFSNTASIYFDYNLPIVTNAATTSVQTLKVSDFDFDDYFTVYPNPAGNRLHIAQKRQSRISSVSVYNMLGQLMMAVSGDSPDVDIAGLAAGNYVVEVISENGVSSAKFIKR